jgi:hypothetical protein
MYRVCAVSVEKFCADAKLVWYPDWVVRKQLLGFCVSEVQSG